MRVDQQSKLAPLIGFVVASIAVAGYFTGLQAPMKTAGWEAEAPSESRPAETRSHEGFHANTLHGASAFQDSPIMATHYADMAQATKARAASWHTQLTSLKANVDLLADVQIKPSDKHAALQKRKQNRAFNGAPPTIPHPVDQRSLHACIACHKDGANTESLRIPRMSHPILGNCTQCHVENSPQHMTATSFRENTFDGLSAPTEGRRAYPGAPPPIPHSTLMRSDCMSCHGLAGLQGIRTTHPWRTNCTQCHAPSAKMDQTLLAEEPKFLPAPRVEN